MVSNVMPSFVNSSYTYSEISSNSNLTPNASLASVASKGPEINLGPEVFISTAGWSVNMRG